MLEVRTEVIAAGVYLESEAAQVLVQMAQRKDRGIAIERALQLGDERRRRVPSWRGPTRGLGRPAADAQGSPPARFRRP